MRREAVDYFRNHRLKLRFPWRLYHRPILDALAAMLHRVPGGDVLNIGSGPFLELPLLPSGHWRYTVCDIDPRATEEARRLHGHRLAGADVVTGPVLPYPDGRFNLVVSMDVIEHVPESRGWLAEVLRVVKPGGHVFLTTPNYGSWSLTWIERTALEAVARMQGFSREHLHPVKFDRPSLQQVLREAGAQELSVEPIALGWVLSARFRKAEAAL